MKSVVWDVRRNFAVLWAVFAAGLSPFTGRGAGSADLFQARNGTPDAPTDPVAWVKGNVGNANSHYFESHSIPYRVVVTGAGLGPHTLVLEWDTTQKGKHAIDYITHFDRLLPHEFGSHTQKETINPVSDLTDSFTPPATFPIPAPSDSGSPVAGQPAASFDALPAGERMLTIWNGLITNVAYLRQDSSSQDAGSTQISIEFVASSSTVVIAFGGHIASSTDWGADSSATSIEGSPYHMRMISFDGTGGNQDRSLQALAVVSPPTCEVSGPTTVCAATTNTFTAVTDAGNKAVYSWSLFNNDSGASIVGPVDGSSVRVRSGSGGSYSVQVAIAIAGAGSTCTRDVRVNPSTVATALSDQTVCSGSSVTFSTTPAGTGPFTFLWRKNNTVLGGATNSSLTLAPVTGTDAGRYCVEVSGACGSVTQCAMLTVEPLPVVTCPPNLAVQCASDVPPPDPGTVAVSGGAGAVTVTHVRDEPVTNGCEVVIGRIYKATDSCGIEAACTQLITVRDTIAPVITCAPNRTVECGAEWSFDLPTAIDNCDGLNAILSVHDTVTNSLIGTLFSATRTWHATDACGNIAACSQTVTIVDTTAPTLTCPDNLTVPCAGPAGASASYAAAARDVCDPDPRVTCDPPSGSLFALGSTTVNCVAIDASGNRSECSFTVTVQDMVLPQIVCPPSLTVLEDPADSGAVTLNYASPTVSDNCDDAPAIVCVPPSGSSFPLGDTAVTCTATDVAGNPNACVFTVRVVPHTIVATSQADSGPGTLRQALLDANAAAGPNVIEFAFAGTPPYVIDLVSPLPPIDDSVVIDGWSLLEFRGDPVLQVNGTNAVPPGAPAEAVGLLVTAGHTTVRGLVLNGFATGIRVEGPGHNVIQGNFIGTDSTGTRALSNRSDGIYISSPDNLVGGSTPQSRNVISANRGRGIVLDTPASTGNVVEGNLIGTGADGVRPLGNGMDGVAIGNGAANNLIGPNNVIAYNRGNGVLIEPMAGPGNGIRGNVIIANGGLNIDIGDDGISPNDNGDIDTGPNDYQNKPTILSARTDGATTTIRGTLNSVANRTYSIDVFVQSPTGSGPDAQSLLGTVTVTTDRDGNGDFEMVLASFLPAGNLIIATATDASNNTSEYSLPVAVGSPPIILAQPVGTNVSPGSFVMLCVAASGTQPLTYQWRHNGANIPDATNACLFFPSVDLSDGGTYTVVVANELGAITSDPALLLLDLPPLAIGDNFADRIVLVSTDGSSGGTNLFATREPGEPNHSGKPGGSSVWYTWTAPADGIATFGTVGSTFDTLLAIYTGSALASLTPVVVDEDGGGFYTSKASFNALAGTAYQIAVDGYGGAYGHFVLTWSLERTMDVLPVITNQPVSRTVASGATVTFFVGAIAACRDNDHDCRDQDRDGHPDSPNAHLLRLSYQWFFNGAPILGATTNTLAVTNVQDSNVGIYIAQVSNGSRVVFSEAAILQINETGAEVQNVQARDKFLDALSQNPLRLGTGPAAGAGANGGFRAASTVVRGYTGTQVFNTSSSATETSDEPICGVIGGASEWISFVPAETGFVFLNTDGSSYDTVIAVFSRMPNSPALQLLGCDNNGGLDGQDSALVVPVEAGKTNFIVVDGVNGATGVLRLNYNLVTPTLLVPIGTEPDGASRLRVTGRPGLVFTIQRSINLQNWSSLVTTNAPTGVFDFTDPGSGSMPSRFYRALVLP